MAKLYFKVGSDWEEVVRLRNEIVKLKQELMSMDGTQSPAAFKALNVQLAASNQRLDELVTNAAKAGAEMETGFKKGIYDGEKAVNSLSEEIIKQKDIIRETQNDVSMLTEQYKKLGKYDPKRQSLSDELNRAKAAFYEVKDIKNLIDTAKSTKQTRIETEKNKTTYQQDLAAAKADWEKAKKGYEVLLKDQQATSEQVKKAREDMLSKEKAYKDLGGITGSSLTKQDNQTEKLRKQTDEYNALLDKQSLEQQRSAEDLQMEVDEARIKAMDEGSAKTIAEMELNFEKEMQAIDRQKEDAFRKKVEDARAAWEANPKNKGKSFNATDLSSTYKCNFLGADNKQ